MLSFLFEPKKVDKVYSYILSMRFYVTPSSTELKVPIKLNTVDFFWNILNRYHTKFAERKRDLLWTILQYKFTFMHCLISGSQVRLAVPSQKMTFFPWLSILIILKDLRVQVSRKGYFKSFIWMHDCGTRKYFGNIYFNILNIYILNIIY